MKQGLMRGLAALTASLCAVSLVAASYAPTRSAFINARLGTVSYRLEETGETTGDSYYPNSIHSVIYWRPKHSWPSRSARKALFFSRTTARFPWTLPLSP